VRCDRKLCALELQFNCTAEAGAEAQTADRGLQLFSTKGDGHLVVAVLADPISAGLAAGRSMHLEITGKATLTEAYGVDCNNRRIDLSFDSELAEGPLPEPAKALSNYPNPFNPSTSISYALSNPGRIRLEVYDVEGKRVTLLVDSTQEPGRYTVTWDGSSEAGRKVASGTYFCRLTTNEGIRTIKMTLLK
jgi:hypothetical protein